MACAGAATAPDVAVAARHCILDWVGVAVRGAREPVAVRARAAATAWSPPGGAATLLGTRARAGALDAALLNGVAGHALDLDDTNPDGFHGHATAAVLPAALALAEQRDAPLHALADALVAGVAGATALGRAMNPAHYDAGWHATATLGTVGAALACAHLAELDDDGRRRAAALAALQAAGSRAAFGSMGKPLQVGKAAANGLLAALLAEQELDVPADVLDALPALYGGSPGAWPETPPERAVAATVFKAHAACHGTHAAIELAARLRAEHAVGGWDVRTLELSVAPALLAVCDRDEPRTGLEAKFSLRFAAALALRGDDTTDPDTFADARIADPELRALAARVRVVPDPELTDWQARGTLALGDGRVLEATADVAAVPTGPVELRHKFMRLATPVLGPDRAAAAARTATAPDPRTRVRELTALLGEDA